MKKQNPPKRHHYLPIFYQKGFLNSNNKHFVFDKKEQKILPPSSPKTKFVINDLNTVFIGDEKNTFIEDEVFQDIDKNSSKIFKQIRDSNHENENISDYDKLTFCFALINLFWRIPNSSVKQKQLISSEGMRKSSLQFKGKNGSTLDKELESKMYEMLEEKEVFKKVNKLVHSIDQFHSGEFLKIAYRWQVLHMIEGEHSFITGDNPFLLRNDSITFKEMIGEFIFPISSTKVFINTKEKLKFFDSNFLVFLNLAIIEQSNRFVCSPDLGYLKKMIEMHKDFKKIKFDFRGKVFKLVELIGTCDSFDEYIEKTKK